MVASAVCLTFFMSAFWRAIKPTSSALSFLRNSSARSGAC
jgi:hypothetical protein